MNLQVMWLGIAGIAGGCFLVALILLSIRTWGLGEDDR